MQDTRGAARHIFVSLHLTNAGSVPCTMLGFPTAQLLAADGSPVPTHVVVDGGGQLPPNRPAPLLVLQPEAHALFEVSWGGVPVGSASCESAATIEFGPPGQPPAAHQEFCGQSIIACNSGELDVGEADMTL